MTWTWREKGGLDLDPEDAESRFPTGLPFGSCEDALDTACGLYLDDPTAWTDPDPRRTNGEDH